MKMINMISMIFIMIIMIMILILNLTSKKSFYDREKSSPFECGFDPKNSARLPFSMQFFLIAVIFLIFDVELTLLLPFIIISKINNIFNFIMIFIIFTLILLIGLYHEWIQGALEWQI